MIREIIVIAAVLTGAGLLAIPAHATGEPTYTCDRLGGDPSTTRVLDNCTASPGAVAHGDFTGVSILESRLFRTRVRCVAGGRADIPHEVFALNCNQIG